MSNAAEIAKRRAIRKTLLAWERRQQEKVRRFDESEGRRIEVDPATLGNLAAKLFRHCMEKGKEVSTMKKAKPAPKPSPMKKGKGC